MTKASKTTAKFWEGRLFKGTYKDKNGKIVELPDWSVTLCHANKVRHITLKTPVKALATKKALDAYTLLRSQGWDALWEVYRVRKPKKEEVKSNAAGNTATISTLGEYITLVEEKCSIGSRTIQTYKNGIRQMIAEMFGITGGKEKYDYVNGGTQKYNEKIDAIKLMEITEQGIEEWKNSSLKRRIKEGADKGAAITSVNSNLAKAKSLFSKARLKEFGLHKTISSPFAEVKKLPEMAKCYFSKFDVKELMEAAKMEIRPVDRNQYLLFILGLGVGMRRDEIDKLLWEHVDLERKAIIIFNRKHHSAEMKGSVDEMPLPDFIAKELTELKETSKTKFVLESDIAPRANAKHSYYRCKKEGKSLCRWLRGKGVDCQKPIHTLRKEFGSQVCKDHGPYAASKALRYAPYSMTERHYVDKRGKLLPNFVFDAT
jgi:integrase